MTAASPVAPAGDFRLEVVVRNPQGSILCSPFVLTVTWVGADGVRHALSKSTSTVDDVASATMTLPGVVKGALRYSVAAQQTCGLLTDFESYHGQTAVQSATLV